MEKEYGHAVIKTMGLIIYLLSNEGKYEQSSVELVDKMYNISLDNYFLYMGSDIGLLKINNKKVSHHYWDGMKDTCALFKRLIKDGEDIEGVIKLFGVVRKEVQSEIGFETFQNPLEKNMKNTNGTKPRGFGDDLDEAFRISLDISKEKQRKDP